MHVNDGVILPGILSQKLVQRLQKIGIRTNTQLARRSFITLAGILNYRDMCAIARYCDACGIRLRPGTHVGSMSDLVKGYYAIRENGGFHKLWLRYPTTAPYLAQHQLKNRREIAKHLKMEPRLGTKAERMTLLYILWREGVVLDGLPLADPIGRKSVRFRKRKTGTPDVMYRHAGDLTLPARPK